MKKLIMIILSVALILTTSIPAFAETASLESKNRAYTQYSETRFEDGCSTTQYTLSKTTVILNIDSSFTVYLLKNGKRITNNVTWTSSNSSIVTVSGGKIKAEGFGTAMITAAYKNKQYSCMVTVQSPKELPLNDETEHEHVHQWITITNTIHHDAEYETIHHDAITHEEAEEVGAWDEEVTETRIEIHYVCGGCGEDFGLEPPPADHIYYHMINNEQNNVYQDPVEVTQTTIIHHNGELVITTVVDQEAWDEVVVVSEAWDEIITTYVCGICGAIQ